MKIYLYRNSHCKDKMVSQAFTNGNPHTWKDHLYIEMGPSVKHWLVSPASKDFCDAIMYCVTLCDIMNTQIWHLKKFDR